jgi:hypothetical protein
MVQYEQRGYSADLENWKDEQRSNTVEESRTLTW